MTSRRIVPIAVIAVVAVALVLLVYSSLRVPPQRSGDGWRVIAQVLPTSDDEMTPARRLSELPPSLASGEQLRPNESAFQVVIGGGECEHLRITDVERADETIRVSVGRYRGVRDRMNGCDDIGKLEAYVVGLSPELSEGALYLSVDGIDPVLIAK